MSYILDALKRAEAERDRGGVPGLHTSSLPVGTYKANRFFQPPTRALFWALGSLFGMMLLLSGGWLLWRGQQQEAALLASSAASITAPAAVIIPPMVLAATPAMSAAAPALRLLPLGTATAPRVASAAAVVGVNVSKGTSNGQLPVPARPAAAQAQAPVTAGVAVATGTPVMAITQLPTDISLSLPKLTVSGSTYSENPAYRMVILNGQVFHEGDKPVADLMLEQITAKTVIFNFKGYRYSVPN